MTKATYFAPDSMLSTKLIEFIYGGTSATVYGAVGYKKSAAVRLKLGKPQTQTDADAKNADEDRL